jgi:hypothetical protein
MKSSKEVQTPSSGRNQGPDVCTEADHRHTASSCYQQPSHTLLRHTEDWYPPAPGSMSTSNFPQMGVCDRYPDNSHRYIL